MSVVTETFPPAPSGMNVALSGQEIDDTEAQYLQDILLDKPGLARRRGPLQRLTTWKELPRRASGIAQTMDPTGDPRYAALTGTTGAGYLTMWSPDFTTVRDYTWPHALPSTPVDNPAYKYRYVHAAPALSGGSWISTASEPDANASLQALGLWYGGHYNTYSTGTITFTRGSATVTGSGTSWSTNVSPGMFLFANTDDASAGTFTNAYIGVVLSVNSDTSITLEQVSPYSGSAGRTYEITPVRGFIPKVAKGQITTATTSTTVSGGGTKFSSQGLGTGTWNIYRQSDLTWVGKVSSVASDISLTLAANAAIAMSDERFVAVRGDWSTAQKGIDIQGATNKVGYLTAIYAERQWYINNGISFNQTYRAWFSDTSDKEAVDMSGDGDWIPVSATAQMPEPVRAAVPTYNALLILKENETFAIYGTSPSSFSAKKLADDGTIGAMGVVTYGGGAIWPGREGLYFYNGVEVKNMIRDKFGDVWKTTMSTIDVTRYRMWATVIREHYILYIEDLDPSIALTKGNTSSTPDHWCFVVNMNTQAISLHTNLKFHGSIITPAQDLRKSRLIVNAADPDLAASNLGKTAAGASTTELVPNGLYAFPITTTAGMGYRTVKVRLDGGGTGTGNAAFKVAIYSDSAGEPGTKLGESAAVTVTDAAAASDVTFTLTDDQWATTGTDLWVVLQGDANADSCRIYHDTASNATRYILGDYALTGFPTTWNTAGDSVQSLDPTCYIVYDGIHGIVCDGEELFDGEGLDDFPTEQGTVRGPDFYFMTKKYNAGNDVQLKRFKQFAIHYLAQGGALNVDTVLGLNEVGATLSTQLPSSVLTWDQLRVLLPNWSAVAQQYSAWDNLISGVFRPKRARFLKKDHLISFRLWQDSATMTRAKVGPFHIAYKLMRPTRVT